MSITYESIKIGVEDEGIKFVENLDLNHLTYDLVDEGGEVFPAQSGATAIARLRAGLPEVDFVVLPA